MSTDQVNVNRREELVNAYFDALDDANYGDVRSVFAEDVTYLFPEQEPIHGLEDAVAFFEDDKPTEETDHRLTRWVHTDEVTVTEGDVTAVADGEPYEGSFCDVFEFDDAEKRITYVGVYSRLDP